MRNLLTKCVQIREFVASDLYAILNIIYFITLWYYAPRETNNNEHS